MIYAMNSIFCFHLIKDQLLFGPVGRLHDAGPCVVCVQSQWVTSDAVDEYDQNENDDFDVMEIVVFVSSVVDVERESGTVDIVGGIVDAELCVMEIFH